jgi:hypothetical protein
MKDKERIYNTKRDKRCLRKINLSLREDKSKLMVIRLEGRCWG